MAHLGFEAYGEGFFGKLLHERGFLPERVLLRVRSKFRAFAGPPQRRVRLSRQPRLCGRREALSSLVGERSAGLDRAKEP